MGIDRLHTEMPLFSPQFGVITLRHAVLCNFNPGGKKKQKKKDSWRLSTNRAPPERSNGFIALLRHLKGRRFKFPASAFAFGGQADCAQDPSPSTFQTMAFFGSKESQG